jgi:hypothetical protein
MPDEGQEFGMKIEFSHGHEIDDANGDAFLKECSALRDKDIAVFRSVPVRGADDFNGGHQMPSPLRIENSNLLLIVIGQRGFDSNAGLGWSPDSHRHAASIFAHRSMGQSIFLERRDVDFDLRTGMHSWLGHIPRG